jgi:hypothetical protein
LGGRDKHLLRLFEHVSPETVRYWFQQMGVLLRLPIRTRF